MRRKIVEFSLECSQSCFHIRHGICLSRLLDLLLLHLGLCDGSCTYLHSLTLVQGYASAHFINQLIDFGRSFLTACDWVKSSSNSFNLDIQILEDLLKLSHISGDSFRFQRIEALLQRRNWRLNLIRHGLCPISLVKLSWDGRQFPTHPKNIVTLLLQANSLRCI